ncbi:hypothetical protein [Aliivibrio fischeri]|uniref:hypothetical protein n=1 Tax=Aliivibrio fischeri TaxID=668 RepID=UPI00159EE57B|nr:hypothetical protein [Aliivibrio fischeri]
MFPPAADYQPCVIPFDRPPYSKDEGYDRDVVWMTYLVMCANQVDRTRKWVENKQADK